MAELKWWPTVRSINNSLLFVCLCLAWPLPVVEIRNRGVIPPVFPLYPSIASIEWLDMEKVCSFPCTVKDQAKWYNMQFELLYFQGLVKNHETIYSAFSYKTIFCGDSSCYRRISAGKLNQTYPGKTYHLSRSESYEYAKILSVKICVEAHISFSWIEVIGQSRARTVDFLLTITLLTSRV